MSGKLIVLAVAAAFYPTLLAIVIIILTRPEPVRLLAAFLAAGMATSITVGLIVLSLVEESGAVAGGASQHKLSPAIDVVVGAASLALSFAIATGRDLPFAERHRTRKEAKQAAAAQSEPKDPWTKRMIGRDSIWLAAALGVVLDLPSVWYLAALKDIAASDHSTGAEVLLVLIFNLIMFALIEIPLAFYLVAPERSAATIARFDSWTRSHMRQIGAGVAFVVGAYLLVDGITGLA